jgi:hypothetical protein
MLYHIEGIVMIWNYYDEVDEMQQGTYIYINIDIIKCLERLIEIIGY